MPAPLTYPGVYVEEIPSGVRPITGVATSVTAFVGRALRGPVDAAITITVVRRLRADLRRPLAREQPWLRGQRLLPKRRLDGDRRSRPQDEDERHRGPDARQRRAAARAGRRIAGRVGLEALGDDRQPRQRLDRHDALQPDGDRRRLGQDRVVPQRLVRDRQRAPRRPRARGRVDARPVPRAGSLPTSPQSSFPVTATATNGNDGDPVDAPLFTTGVEPPRRQEGPVRARERRPREPARDPAVHLDGRDRLHGARGHDRLRRGAPRGCRDGSAGRVVEPRQRRHRRLGRGLHLDRRTRPSTSRGSTSPTCCATARSARSRRRARSPA